MAKGASKVLILGGNNQICCALADRLTAQRQVCIVSRREAPAWFSSGPKIQWRNTVPEAEFEHAILIGPLNVLTDRLQRVTILGGALGVSSMSAVAKRRSLAQPDRELASRLERAEAYFAKHVARTNAAATVLRPTMIYGRGMDQNLTRMAAWINAGRRIPLCRPTGLRQPIHVDDIADLCASWMDNPHSGVYEIGGGEMLRYDAMVHRVFASLGREPRLLRLPYWALRTASTILGQRRKQQIAVLLRMSEDLIADNEPAYKDFRFAPRVFQPSRGTWSPPTR